MKLILTGDLHLTGRNPISRTDDLPSVQENKINQIESLREEYGAEWILQPGDFFDSFNPSYSVINRYLKILSDRWKAVLGQHDMYMWNLQSINRI